MSFKELYDFAQTEAVYGQGKRYVSRAVLKDKAVEVAGIEKVVHIQTGADLGVSRGFWLAPTNKNHPLVKQLGCHIIVTQRGLNNCWDRFVYVKELTHLFDVEQERTASAEDFDGLLGEFATLESLSGGSPQFLSEAKAVWAALALLCPEEQRLTFEKERNAVMIDDYEIALRLRIPQIHVPKLFSPSYQVALKALLDG
ncbi:hypothetical protein [Thalassobius sp. MITS945101]|uniref:hypothetical protein n=1 Tax=Thalassobius sp. MITS945101 TaxID=3096994 RepID=UPI00399BCFA4